MLGWYLNLIIYDGVICRIKIKLLNRNFYDMLVQIYVEAVNK